MDGCTQRVVLKVEGMTCGGCTGAVTKALEAVQGVKSAKVDLATKLATVDGTAKLPDLLKAIAATGKTAAGCACNCGPGCACVAGECGCAVGACKCDPSTCTKTSFPKYAETHLALAAACGALVGIVLAKTLL